jgi:translation initiation factor 2 subunit 3
VVKVKAKTQKVEKAEKPHVQPEVSLAAAKKLAKPEKVAKPAKLEKAEKAEKPEKAEKSGKADKAQNADKSDSKATPAENIAGKVSISKVDERMIPTANIGMIGHVAHGKTTLTEALTGKLTLTHSEELKRGITIRLGYADAHIYRCKNCNRLSPNAKCPYCFGDAELVRTVSFIDAPGHETLMATVLTGTSLMDGAVLVIAANEKCPQPQTREHLTAIEVAGIKNVVIVQNKIDLVDEKGAMRNYKEIKDFVKGTILENAPIIPISAQKRVNVDVLLETLESIVPSHVIVKDEEQKTKILIARSFDVNRPGTALDSLTGGVLGGSIISGTLKVGDDIEVRPGIKKSDAVYKPLRTKIIGLQKAGINLQEAGPGGLLGIMTELDPALTKSDYLVGNVVGLPGTLPDAKDTLDLAVTLLDRVVGSETMGKVDQLRPGESLMINVGTARSVGTVESKKKFVTLRLKIPICVQKGDRVAISRLVSGRWRLIGYGIVE